MKIGIVSTYKRKALLLLALLGLCMGSYAATTGLISLSGAEQFNSSNGTWDSGTVSVSINGYVKSVSYGQYSTPASIASAIAAQFSSDCNGPANAKSGPGGVIYVQMRDSATLSQLTVNTYSSISFNGTVNTNSLTPTITTATIASTQLLLGQSTNVSVQVSCGSACGSVDYRIDGGEWGTVALDANGHFSAATSTSLPAGLHNVVINYLGNGSYLVSNSNPVSFMISSSSTPTNPTTIYSYSNLSYQPNGNVAAYNDQVNGNWSNIQYDGVNRLKAATQTINGATQYLCWGYDSFGNRTPQTVISPNCYSSPPSPPTQYNANNQNAGLGYDTSGDVTNDGQNQYLYNAEGRVCAVQYQVLTGGSSSMMGYIYDAEGRRVAKGTISTWSCDFDSTSPTFNGFQETAGYVLGPGGEQVTEVDGGGNWQHTNVFGNGQLIATYDPDGLHFHLSDWLGTRRVDTDYAGNPASTYQTLPFGELVPQNQTISNTEHLFTGKERDAESGLDYFGARMYGSSMGRFMSPDWSSAPEAVPYADFGNPQSLNLYAYVDNNPLRVTDPDGHSHLECVSVEILDTGVSIKSCISVPDWRDLPILAGIAYGHHGIPQSLYEYLPRGAARTWLKNKFITGPLADKHYYDAAHRAYNKAVRDLLDLNTPEGEERLAQQGLDGAKEAARRVLDSNDSNIKGFLDNMKTPDGLTGRQALEGAMEGDEGALLDVVVDGAAGLAAVD